MIDETGKHSVKEALRARAAAELEASREAVRVDTSAARIDQDAPYSVDDLSQSEEAGEYVGMFEGVEARQVAVLAQIDALDVSPRDAIGPGAIIAFDGDHYVVGVVADAIECDGVTYEGISVDSPVYAAIQGLRAGDTFSVNGHEHRIDLVV